MKFQNEKIPSPKELEKEIGEFLAKKFGGEVKIVSPGRFAHPSLDGGPEGEARQESAGKRINFDMKPRDLVDYLDQYIVRQDSAKAILATKICTHFNRIRRRQVAPGESGELVGGIKNNILMIGPTGVGKTYMIRLIAKKLGVPLIKGDATKFSETGYVGGDVEDLVRDLVREADGDIELAENGIIYIDEIDKIAGSQNLIGADVSRSGVQRALLKPMEETEVELKVPHDPISMMQEIERFRRTGKRERRAINTRNILFIVSGAFGGLNEIIGKRVQNSRIGFGAPVRDEAREAELLRKVSAEDLVAFGFESEFIGRLPVIAVMDRLSESDLFEILKNPNNPVILSKKLDFDAYGIRVKFEEAVLGALARAAYSENTGARGLVSAIEKALIRFETHLPSGDIRRLPITEALLRDPEKALDEMASPGAQAALDPIFERLGEEEVRAIRGYISQRLVPLSRKHNLTLTPAMMDLMAEFYANRIMDVGLVIQTLKEHCDEIKKTELHFYKNHDLNIVLEEEAILHLARRLMRRSASMEELRRQLAADLQFGLKLVRERTGRNRFYITRAALENPDGFIRDLLESAGPAVDPADETARATSRDPRAE